MAVRNLQPRALGTARARGGRQRGTGQHADEASRPSLDVIQSKIRPPALRPGVVPRAALVSRLRRDPAAVVTVVARAGYGKTTLLAQWAAAEARPVAWLSLDVRDNDPAVLVRDFVAAVDRVQPFDPRLLGAVARLQGRPPAVLVARTAEALASGENPLMLALDDADVLNAPDALRILSILTSGLSRGSTLALAGRTPPRLSNRLRARRGSRELGVEELALTKREAQLLLQDARVPLSDAQIAQLIELCEGWPAALHLASLSISEGGAEAGSSVFGGSDRYLAEYLRAECLNQLRPNDLRFLRRASILDNLDVPLCDAVLQESDSESRLQRLARADIVLPAEGRSRGYRFHRLFREFLARELVDEEPHMIPRLHRRAADVYELIGDLDSALVHAEQAGDPDRVAALLGATALRGSCDGGVDEVDRRLAHFEESWDLRRYPAVAAIGSWVHAYQGRTRESRRWLELAERGARRQTREAPTIRASLSVVRAALCRGGARRMVADTGAALAKLPRSSPWYPHALHMSGSAAMLAGADREADSLLADAAREAAVRGYPQTEMIAVSQRSLIARAGGDADRADALANEASNVLGRAELERYPAAAIAYAVSARAALRHGRWADARELVDAARPLSASVTEALPWLAVALRLELGRCYLALRDVDAALGVVAEIREIVRVRPSLGVLEAQAQELREQVESCPERGRESPNGLTPAELRLLPLLATHLSFREIADRLDVSRNTVKTQAISIYRKLGVTGRSEAMKVAGTGLTRPA